MTHLLAPFSFSKKRFIIQGGPISITALGISGTIEEKILFFKKEKVVCCEMGHRMVVTIFFVVGYFSLAPMVPEILKVAIVIGPPRRFSSMMF